MIIEKTINIALVNEGHLLKSDLKEVLSSDSCFAILAEVVQIEKIINIIESSPIDIVIFQVDEPRYIEVEFLIKRFPNIKVVYVSNSTNKEEILEIIKLGVQGYLYSENPQTNFINTVKNIHSGEVYYQSEVLELLISDYIRLTQGSESSFNCVEYKLPLHLLTRRECEILQLLTDGKSNRGIAEELIISEKTVKNHVSNILQKLDVNDRTQAVVLGIKKGWVNV